MSRTRIPLVLLGLLIFTAVLLRAGLTRALVDDLFGNEPPRPVQLRVWDWWSPASNEEYGQYFDAIEEAFEAQNPDVDIVYQIVPFGNYVQKLSTAMVGSTPPDVFQSAVYWAEGFYQRGMLRPLGARGAWWVSGGGGGVSQLLLQAFRYCASGPSA